jgi:hypothetical protein
LEIGHSFLPRPWWQVCNTTPSFFPLIGSHKIFSQAGLEL